ncbi:imidazoleglycerol-phosphate dehydratase, partial [Halalkalibacterium halodurans]|nr:imidazoleglycerol-phosphate dehydratase [Halalkalibacterium halodurans]
MRKATIERKTGETQISLTFAVDGEGQSNLTTGVPFMTHMLDLFTKHGHFNLTIDAKGDTEVDDHHTTEDLGICLGLALKEALADKKGIRRYGSAFVPMDETLAQVVVDLSNRPHLEFRADMPSEKVGTFDTELVHEFLWKLALEARMNLHV